MKAWLVVAVVAAVALSGCNGGKGGPGKHELKAGKGAITGVVLDDVIRPVPKALVLLSNGQTATADSSGEFTFLDLEPGAYILRVQADDHEAAPRTVDVVAGQYAEAELLARRIFNQGGQILTREYSVFVPCAFAAPVATANPPCLVDLSGDTDRFGFIANYTGYADVTYIVTEMKAARPASQDPGSGAYKVVVRDERGAVDSDYYASAFTTDSDYLRLVMKVGARSSDDTEDRNVVWNNSRPMQVAFFPQGTFKGETQPVNDQVDDACQTNAGVTCLGESRGIGAQFGVRARFIQSVFIGEPEVDIEGYGVLD